MILMTGSVINAYFISNEFILIDFGYDWYLMLSSFKIFETKKKKIFKIHERRNVCWL